MLKVTMTPEMEARCSALWQGLAMEGKAIRETEAKVTAMKQEAPLLVEG